MRFALTAKTIANVRAKGQEINHMTAANIQKVLKFRPERIDYAEPEFEEREEWVRAKGIRGGSEGMKKVVRREQKPRELLGRLSAEEQLDEMVKRFERLGREGDEGVEEWKQRVVYPEQPRSR